MPDLMTAPPILRVRRMAILGCGLMGGSFALALKSAGLVDTVVGWSRSAASAHHAQQLGVVDEVASSPAEAARLADVVLLSVPVAATSAALSAIAGEVGEDTLCMDVGSTKADVVEAAAQALGPHIAGFVPAHPIAGKEKAGVSHADAALYRGCRVILTPTPHVTDPLRTARARQIWEALGARVSEMTAQAHDDALGAVSHLPHLLAFAYVMGVASRPNADELFALAGPGFRDFTRIAAGDPTLWRDVLRANRCSVQPHLQAFRDQLQRLEQAIADDDTSFLEDLIGAASSRRRSWKPG